MFVNQAPDGGWPCMTNQDIRNRPVNFKQHKIEKFILQTHL